MKIVHCKKEPFDVYIGRPSKWGNDWSHKEGTKAKFKTKTVEESIEKYREWITQGNENGDGRHLLNDLHELKGKVLGCWCFPQRCHGEVLLELVNEHCKS